MSKAIISVGFSVPGAVVTCISHMSQESILDADIVLFNPDISDYLRFSVEQYQGKPSLDENRSFALTENTRRWRTELLTAINAGKTVVVAMTAANVVFVDTGQRQYSGTGRNRFTTRIVSQFDPYSAIPTDLGTVVRAFGERMKAVADLGVLSNYWHDFSEYSSYEVYLQDFKGKARLVTQTGDMTVAAVLRPKSSRGALVLLPPPDLEQAVEDMADAFRGARKSSRKQSGKNIGALTKKAHEVIGKKYVNALIEIDKAIRAEAEQTPPPAWANDQDFGLAQEIIISGQLSENEGQISALRQKREELLGKLNEAVVLKNLLFEKGKPLERSILLALRLLGFRAEPYKAGNSEFDVVFVGPDDRRLLGEAEGKDDKSINIDKLDQLDRNLREDFQRPEIAEFAKGVLFGNASRFTRPSERGSFFTEKCLKGAQRSGVALVRTTDLFYVARYLQEHDDPGFAVECRNSILDSSGKIVVFPAPPEAEK